MNSKLEIKNLAYSEVGKKETFEISLLGKDFPDFDYESTFRGDISVTRIDDGLLAQFKIKTEVKLICDRCQSEYLSDQVLTFSRDYFLGRVEEGSDSLPVSKEFTIDIIEPIREEVLLSLPFKKICKDVCKGLCAHCGKNLNLGKCKCGKV